MLMSRRKDKSPPPQAPPTPSATRVKEEAKVEVKAEPRDDPVGTSGGGGGGGSAVQVKEEAKEEEKIKMVTGVAQSGSSLDRNKLEAQAMKAQLRGDTAKYDSLMAQLAVIDAAGGPRPGAAPEGSGGGGGAAAARGVKESAGLRDGMGSRDWTCPSCSANMRGNKSVCQKCTTPRPAEGDLGPAGKKPNVVVLGKFDEKGRPLSLSYVAGMSDQDKATRDRKVHTDRKQDFAKGVGKDKDTQRGQYFQDDDMSVDQMVQREKLSKGHEYDDNIVDNLSKKKRGPNRDVYGEEEEYGGGLGDSLKAFESRDKKQKMSTLETRARQQQIQAHNKAEALHNKDRFSLDNPRFPKHMLIAAGPRAYLMLQTGGRLSDGHCLIVPQTLAVSTIQCDEDTLEEMRNFKKCLLRMFNEQDKDCVFFETAMDLGKMPHAYLECVPLPRAQAANAPMYFKKALSECENEWDAQNKQIIDTKGVKKLSSKIPRHMPYFSVEFGLQNSSKAFGRDILAGILNLPAQTLARQRSSIEEEKQLAQGFEASFKPFDWTASQ